MEFDWLEVNFQMKDFSPKEIEESFEDPFAVKLLPTEDYPIEDARYFCLGRSVRTTPLLSVFWTNGKRYRVIYARKMTETEEAFYVRRRAAEL